MQLNCLKIWPTDKFKLFCSQLFLTKNLWDGLMTTIYKMSFSSKINWSIRLDGVLWCNNLTECAFTFNQLYLLQNRNILYHAGHMWFLKKKLIGRRTFLKKNRLMLQTKYRFNVIYSEHLNSVVESKRLVDL